MKIICEVTRGEHIESQHEVYAVAIDEKSNILLSVGNPDYITCIRSALKPFQAAAAIATGAVEAAGFTTEEIALMCASHNGEKIHVNTAMNMLQKLDYNISQYECGSHAPHNKETREEIQKSNITINPLYNNCSGKHSGMLAISKHLNINPEGYTKREHPVQKIIFKQLSKLTGYRDFSYGIDGCSAPTPFLSLLDIAKLYQKLGAGNELELSTAYDAMSKHPYLIGGKNRYDTAFNDALQGRGVCKAGGEAIRGIVIQTSQFGLIGIAIKIVDGNQRAIEVATMAILNHLNILHKEEKEKLLCYENVDLFNHKNIHIGKIIPQILI